MSRHGDRELDLKLQVLRMRQELLQLGQRLVSAQEQASALKDDLDRQSKRVRQLEQSWRYWLGCAIVDGLRLPLRLWRQLACQWRADARPRQSRKDDDAPTALPDREQQQAPRLVELFALTGAADVPGALADLRIASVMDPFSHASFGPDCHLIPLRPGEWAAQINESRPHLLLVESAWIGLQGEWKGRVERAPGELRSLVASCRQAGIPTVFWNKEDPLHFEAFVETARLFDHVFTTDASCIPRYRRVLGHDRVGLLPFGLQPRSHHPVHDGPRSRSSVFAGAWYGRMPARSRDFETVADALMLAGDLVIHDRHDGRGAPHQRFPSRFSECIRAGVPYEATPGVYRSHCIGVNLNTVKQSPTMFARRVLELIGCNTSVYGNYSRALHLLFGELTVSSDDPERIIAMAWDELRAPDALPYRQRRLCALRKVLKEHTWSNRLRVVCAAALGTVPLASRGRIWVVARAEDASQLERVTQAFFRQRWEGAQLLLSLAPGLDLPSGAKRLNEADLAPDDWVALFHSDDFYGCHYLEDLALGRAFGLGTALGKGTWFASDEKGSAIELMAGNEYRNVAHLALRRSLVRADRLPSALATLVEGTADAEIRGDGLVSLDTLSYVENGAGREFPELEEPSLDQGVSLEDIATFMCSVEFDALAEDASFIDGSELARLFNNGVVPPGTSATTSESGLEICSLLEAGQHDAMFSAPIERSRLERDGELVVCLRAPPANELGVFLDAMDAHGAIVQRVSLWPEAEARLVPEGVVVSYRLAIALNGRLVQQLEGIHVGAGPARPLILPGQGRLLLVSNGYPEAGRLYRNAFLHRRVLAYRKLGIGVDVIVVAANEPQRTYEHEGVLVHVCSPAMLAETLKACRHKAIAVHFLDEAMWESLRVAAERRRVVIWLHGSEVQSWRRRRFNYKTHEALLEAARLGEARDAFWRNLLAEPPSGLRLIFVSKTFAEEVWSDLGITCAADMWRVVHNPIDTDLFKYAPKPPEQRLSILSVRPHDSRIYANDLVADAIHALADHEIFPSLRFTLVGDGPLWEENFASLTQYPNVDLRRGFLRQDQIARLHKSHGVFLVPTRGDTQGVSRDEAMSSGLVPVTCDVGSVAEFVDHESGILCPADAVDSLADAIMRLAKSPELFSKLSRGAAVRVRAQSSVRGVAEEELRALEIGVAGRGA